MGVVPDAIGAKLQRAFELLVQFDALCQAWIDQDSGEIVHENRPETSEYLVICKRAPVPPIQIGIILGEAIHAIRSTLDHLIYALAVQQTQQDPPPQFKTLDFPIFWTQKEFDQKWGKRLGIFSSDAQKIIRDYQPYTEYESHPNDSFLWILHHLDNIYKHRRIGVVGQVIGDRVEVAANIDVTITSMNAELLKDNAVLFHFLTNGSCDVDIKVNFTHGLSFDEPGVVPERASVVPILNSFLTLCSKIVIDLGDCF
jgi:hypothetical protein